MKDYMLKMALKGIYSAVQNSAKAYATPAIQLKKIKSELRRSRQSLEIGPAQFCFISAGKLVCGEEALKICGSYSSKVKENILLKDDNINELIFYSKNLLTHVLLLKKAKEDFDEPDWGFEQNCIDRIYSTTYKKRILKLIDYNLQNTPEGRELIRIQKTLVVDVGQCRDSVFTSKWVRLAQTLVTSQPISFFNQLVARRLRKARDKSVTAMIGYENGSHTHHKH